MVRRHIMGRGIRQPAILRALLRVPREEFLEPGLAALAYRDQPAPIGLEQTISQPFVVALMIEALMLRSSDRVLEIGTGSGYTTALLTCLVREVYSVERFEDLAIDAGVRLKRLGVTRTQIKVGDGSLGWPDHAPYDAIVVWAAAPAVPTALEKQLAIDGHLVIPVGESRDVQNLLRVTRAGEQELERAVLDSVRFVPLVGEQGWRE